MLRMWALLGEIERRCQAETVEEPRELILQGIKRISRVLMDGIWKAAFTEIDLEAVLNWLCTEDDTVPGMKGEGCVAKSGEGRGDETEGKGSKEGGKSRRK